MLLNMIVTKNPNETPGSALSDAYRTSGINFWLVCASSHQASCLHIWASCLPKYLLKVAGTTALNKTIKECCKSLKANEKKNAKSLTFFTSPPFIFQLALKLNVLFSESVSKPGNEEAAAKVGKTWGKKVVIWHHLTEVPEQWTFCNSSTSHYNLIWHQSNYD